MVESSDGQSGGSDGVCETVDGNMGASAEITGVVLGKRVHGKRLAFVDLEVQPMRKAYRALVADDDEEEDHDDAKASAKGAEFVYVRSAIPVRDGERLPRFQVVCSLQCLATCENDESKFGTLVKLLARGALVRIEGTFGRTKSSQGLFAEHIEFVRIQPDPGAVIRLLRHFRRGELFDGSYCARALGFEDREGPRVDAVRRLASLVDSHPSQLRKEVAGLVRLLRGKPVNRHRMRSRRTGRAELGLLSTPGASALRAAFPIDAQPELHSGNAMVGLLARLEANLPDRDDAERLRYLREKKWPQVLWMVAQFGRVVRDASEGGRPIVRAADIGAGRGDLSICLAKAFPSIHFTVVDVNGPSLEAGRALADALGVGNVAFRLWDIRSDAMRAAPPFDVYLGLHACGGLTDAVLFLALNERAHFLVW